MNPQGTPALLGGSDPSESARIVGLTPASAERRRPFRWWHRWFPPCSNVYDHCPESPDGVHETREVSGPGAAGLHQDYQECVHCGRFW